MSVLAAPSARAEAPIRVVTEDEARLGVAGVRSLEAALDEARRRRASGPLVAPVVIELGPGTHRISAPVHLTDRDSGTGSSPLILRARPSMVATLSGGVALVPVPAPVAALEGYPDASRPHLRLYRLPDAAARAPDALVPRRFDRESALVPFEIFDQQGALRPARWPDADWAIIPPAAGTRMLLERPRSWPGRGSRDAWACGFFKEPWAYECLRLEEANATTLRLAEPPQYGLGPAPRLALLNDPADVDAPGEWHRDPLTRLVAVWPRDESPLIASAADGLLVLTGVRHVRIEGLTFEHARGTAIRIDGGDHVTLSGLTVRHVGGRAIVVQGARDTTVDKSRIHDTGDGGIRMTGGDRISLAGNRLAITGTSFARTSRLGLTYRPAISIDGVGIAIRGNVIAEAEHSAIEFMGNDHVIEFNEIRDVVRETGDAGAIYTGRDWTARGTIIRHNWLHDIRGRGGREVKGIYLDDFASGIRVESNIFLRVDQPVFIGGGRDNIVDGNIFIASSPGVHIDGRGLTWAAYHVTDRDGTLRHRLAAMPIESPPWRTRFPQLATLLADDPATPKRNRARGNLFAGGDAYRLLPEVDAGLQLLDAASVLDDPARVGVLGAARSLAEIRDRIGPALPPHLAGFPFDAIGSRR